MSGEERWYKSQEQILRERKDSLSRRIATIKDIAERNKLDLSTTSQKILEIEADLGKVFDTLEVNGIEARILYLEGRIEESLDTTSGNWDIT